MSGKMIVQQNWRLAVVLGGAVAVAVGAMPLACSGSPSESSGNGQGHGPASPSAATPGSDVGTVGLALSLPGGQVLSSVTYELKNSGGTDVALLTGPNPGTVNVANSSAIHFQIGGVPAATGDSISLTAATAGGATCQGSATGITVTAGGTTSVIVQMACSLPGQDAGNVFVTGATSNCGTWTSLSTTSNEVFVGESLVLTAAATGPNPSALGYTWTMSNPIGAFGATGSGVGAQGQDENVGPSDPQQFMCTAAGTTTITLVVDDGPNDAGVCPTGPATLTTTVTCDAAPANSVAAAWVELAGPNGAPTAPNGLTGTVAIARAITEATVVTDGGTNPCPTITINGGAPVQMNVRAGAALPTTARSVNTPPAKPALFPVTSCEYPLPAGVTSAVVAGRSLPVPKANPTKIVVIGDTGCRLQNGNGTQSCNDTNPNGTDTPYPFATIAALAAAQNPDLVLHVGDYAYRDNPCPAGSGYNCGGSPWGFGWDTWQADLFSPGAPLLAAAPWIMTRGNHEQCNRAGQGWYRFLDINPYDTTGVSTCDNAAYDTTVPGGNYNNPFLVNINSSTQVLVFDTANAKPQSGTPSGSGSTFATTYAAEVTQADNLVGAAPLAFNIWSNHHPIFSYATGNPPATPIPLLPPIMKSVNPGTYFPPAINLSLHGHTHDYQAMNFASNGSFQPPAELVAGNTGDILDSQLQYPLPSQSAGNVASINDPNITVATFPNPDGGAPVQEFATSDNGGPFQNPNSQTDNGFGYMVLQFNAGPPATWTSTEYRTDNTVRDVCTIQASGQMSCASWGIIQPDGNGVY